MSKQQNPQPSLDCQQFELRIHQKLDDRLTLHHDELLQNHANQCRPCRHLLTEYEALFFDPAPSNQLLPAADDGTSCPPKSARHFIRALATAALFLIAVRLVGVHPNAPISLAPETGSIASLDHDTESANVSLQPEHLIASTNFENQKFDLEPDSSYALPLAMLRPERIAKLAQNTPQLVSSIKFPNQFNFQSLSRQLDPVHTPYLQYPSEIPGLQGIQDSLHLTLDLLTRPFFKPASQTPDLGQFSQLGNTVVI